MRLKCPYCQIRSDGSGRCPNIVRKGFFYRKSDSRHIQRFWCQPCQRGFSRATNNPCFGQKKRHCNEPLRRLLCSGVSQRRAAQLLGLHRITVARKFLFLAAQAKIKLLKMNKKRVPSTEIEFDDMESFEHTKCKPLSITLAVDAPSRHILGFEVSMMPAKGKLTKIALKKYGPRPDERPLGRARLFERIKPLVHPLALIKSDQNPHYPSDVKRYFPKAQHKAFKGRRGCIVGQGELKKTGFDPLFSLNHTCAKLRADINRLFRRTWCTTKKAERLSAHIALYAHFHNQSLMQHCS